MAEQPLHICLLTYRGNPQSGGQGIYVRLLTRELSAMGHRVDVWSGQPYPELDGDVKLVKIPSLDLWNHEMLRRWPTLRELRDPVNVAEWLRTRTGEFAEPRTFTERVARCFGNLNGDCPYDIVHDNQSLGAKLLDVQARLPVVATIHHPVTRDLKYALKSAPSIIKRYGVRRFYSFLPMQQRVARALDQILTVSEASANDLAREYGIAEDRLRVVGNGINIDVFGPRPEIKRRDDHLITTLSADQPLKGFTFLLDAFAELRKERPSLELTVIGCSVPRKQTLQKIRKLGLNDAVRFSGRVAAEEIATAYAGATVAVVASLYEGFGFPAGEAMACEVPVVSTSGGALPEVVGKDGVAGVLVEPGNAAALARALREMLAAPPESRRRMGEAGRRRVLEHFTWRRAAERTIECYREAIETHSKRFAADVEPAAALTDRRARILPVLEPQAAREQVEPC